jgi:DNA topoisomerase VI subunit A
MASPVRIQVLMPPEEAERFEDYCNERGFKKSTLIVRLIREHLDHERFKSQRELFETVGEGQRQR